MLIRHFSRFIGEKFEDGVENLRNLEYAKGSRHYEDEINQNATIDDLDTELLAAYKEYIRADYNVVKDKNIDAPILRIIDQANERRFYQSQHV